MKVEIRIDPACREPRLILETAEVTEELRALVERLQGDETPRLTAWNERGAVFLPLDRVLRIYAQRQQVLAEAEDGVYTVRARLYELEERLTPHRFVRISNSEIVNGRRITGMDFSLTGTICLSLKGGVKTYVSRRYVSRIRKLFDV